MKKNIMTLTLVFHLFSSFVFAGKGFAENRFLMEGMTQCKQGNFEEAIALLSKAREAEPDSSTAVFALGLAYKQTLAYDKALVHFLDAVRLKPRIRDAVVELAYIYLQTGQTEEAGKWIGLAEKEEIFPAKTAFLKGLVLQKQEKNREAIASFEKAKSLDSTLTQPCEYNIALCHIKQKDLAEAGKRLQAVILYDPKSDLSTFARQYYDMLVRRMDMEKPLHLTFAVFGQYDSNVVLKPGDSSVATGITNEDSTALTTSFRADYAPLSEGPWLFNAQYSFYNRLHHNHSTSHDMITNSIYAAPGYSFGDWALHLAARYNHVLLREPGYKHYLSEWSAGPLARTFLGANHILEIYAGYDGKAYAGPPLSGEEDRDADVFDTWLSWIWVLKTDSFFSLRYEFSHENADGANWENQGHRFSANTTVLIWNQFKLQLGAEAFLQDFDNTHTTFDKKREDNVYQFSSGLTWDVIDHASLILEYNRTNADSNLSVYDYERDLYTLGFEYRY